MILHRCLPWDRDVDARARGGAVWFPRLVQGAGRHDNPLLYGCLYTSASATSALVEQLARFSGNSLGAEDLVLAGLPLALATLELDDTGEVIDLDDPSVLVRERLRPSLIATHERSLTQADAERLYRDRPDAAGLRWWSTFESQWPNVTIFDRAAPSVSVSDVRVLEVGDEVVQEAARFLGLPLEP